MLHKGSQIVFDRVNLDTLHHWDEGYDGVSSGSDIVDQQCFEWVRSSLKYSSLIGGIHRPEPSNR